MVEFEMEQRKDGWFFTAKNGDEVLGTVTINPSGKDAVIHNEVYKCSPSLMKQYRIIFKDIKAVLKSYGVDLIIAVSDNYNDMIGKYWRFMGFKVFGSKTEKGVTVHYAVMEA